MRRFAASLVWTITILGMAGAASAETPDLTELLGPPPSEGPVVVETSFHLHDVNEINERDETFAFSGVLTLRWRDDRLTFDPAVEGVNEKVFQGAFQFNEIATGWYPQVFLVNESGAYETYGVALRGRPDGVQTLTQSVTAEAKAELNMRRFPLDRQRLEAVFEVLGFDASEVALRTGPHSAASSSARLPQWQLTRVSLSSHDHQAPYAGPEQVASRFVVTIDAERKAFFITRLVIIPLVVIALLSFSVFWMDRSLLADRLSVSFIGILTGVAYQIVLADFLPQISYFTLIHGVINLSFFMMCATVVINLVVGRFDQRGEPARGDRLDQRCRWLFPAVYFGLMLVQLFIALTFF